MKTWYNFSEAAPAVTDLFVYGDIGAWDVSVAQFAKDLSAIPAGNSIKLRIASNGGIVTDGWAMYGLLKERGANVVCYVDGLAASMATIVMLAASKVVAAAGSWIMIHNVQSGAWGEAAELRKEADVAEKMTAQLLAIYVAKTGKSEAEVKAKMDAETWFTAEEALAFGLIDEIAGEVTAQACAELGKADLSKIKAPVALTTFIGSRKASANNKPSTDMKNLLKALAEAKMIGSVDVNEETAVAQFTAYLSTKHASSSDDAARIKTLEAELTTAKATIEAAKKTEADTVVAAAVASGRIKDDADLRAKWSASYVRDPAGTKSMLDSIPEAKGRPAGVPPVANHTTNTQGQQQQATTLTGRDRIAAAWAPAIKA
jgi:ATP-dependent Clp endopeptidase proteolytic subunit ClpP